MSISGISSSSSVGASVDLSATRKAQADKIFKELDTDQDGTLSTAEMAAARAKRPATTTKNASMPTPPSADEMFKAADRDGNGSVSKDEFSAVLAETETRQSASRPAGGAKHAGGGGPPPAGGAKGASGGSSGGTQKSKSASTDPADANGDGKVSLAEQMAYDLTHPKTEAAKDSTAASDSLTSESAS